MRIIIVEDEIRIREGLRKLLDRLDEDYQVVGEADDGRGGLELCRELSPDLVITDVQMPEMDGLEMLKALSEEGIPAKAIVLSAYSEFEYARTAMKLGVTEYLLKPLSLNDLSQALEHIKQQIAEDKSRKPEQIGTLSQTFREIINGRIRLDEETASYLFKTYQIEAGQNYVILLAYLGGHYNNEASLYSKRLSGVLSAYKGIDYCILEDEYRRSLVAVICHYESRADLERWIQYQLLQQVSGGLVCGLIEVEGLEKLKQGFACLYPYMDWNISFQSDILISYPKITQVRTHLCVYPQEIEAKMKAAVCSADPDREHRLMDKFMDSFRDGKVYDPREIKESYVRFIWAVLEIAKDVGYPQAGKIRRQKLLEQIMNAKTREELSEVCRDILDILTKGGEEPDSSNLTVKRAKSMIHEFYHTGITLEEIASRLNITPEYLGSQFHKETGTTFSAYMKNFRISKAKELLVGTSLKLYEIAERVGYSDPKYFSKVFRDVTGSLPAEYRKNK